MDELCLVLHNINSDFVFVSLHILKIMEAV